MRTGNVMIGAVKKASSKRIGVSSFKKGLYKADTNQVLIYDEIGPQLVRLQSAVQNLKNKAKYDKWVSALSSIETALNNLDNKIGTYDRKLGAIDI